MSDWPVGTVRSRVARARATLMDLLDDGGTSHALEAVGEEESAAPAA